MAVRIPERNLFVHLVLDFILLEILDFSVGLEHNEFRNLLQNCFLYKRIFRILLVLLVAAYDADDLVQALSRKLRNLQCRDARRKKGKQAGERDGYLKRLLEEFHY